MSNQGSSSNLELKEFFKSAGITKQDLQDKEKREFICQFLKANIDKLFSESDLSRQPSDEKRLVLPPQSSARNSKDGYNNKALPPSPPTRRKNRPLPPVPPKRVESQILESSENVKDIKPSDVPVPKPRKSLLALNQASYNDYVFGRQINPSSFASSQAANPFQRCHQPAIQTRVLPAGYIWIDTDINNCGNLLSKAILVGHEDGDPIYVGRARLESDVYPCKIVPNKNMAYITQNSRVKTVTKFEIYCKNTPTITWAKGQNGGVPNNAVMIGKINDEEVYVGREIDGDSTTMGKIQQSAGCCYVIKNGSEVALTEYEVMILQD